jgi:APA family basic amino acid/polyamine antiporter
VAFLRSLGRGAVTALVINSIIGSGIFGLPTELTRLLGRASPFAMIAGALVMALIIACMAEVASQFSGAGGPYAYARTAFGRFVALQVGWFWLLSMIAGGAANANLFVVYLAGIWPTAANSWTRVVFLAALIALPTVFNYRGVRSGANFSTLLTVAKMLPLVLLIAIGLLRFAQRPELISSADIVRPGLGPWLTALLLLIFPYGGYENALAPGGEVKEPRRTLPFALATGLAVCASIYALVQFVTVFTIGASASNYPLADTASVLLGGRGALFVSVAVLISTYGWISGGILNAPRIFYSLAENGDAPAKFASLHPKFRTPGFAILIYAVLVWGLAASGTFLWLLALTAGSMMVTYGITCAALVRLRRVQPHAAAMRVPLGVPLAVAGIAICLVLLSRLGSRQLMLMGVTAFLAFVNWWWAKRKQKRDARLKFEVASKSGEAF